MKENRVRRAYRRLAEYAERQAERLALREYRKREAWRRIGQRLSGARTRASNAWYRAAGRQISGTRQGIRNARNQRTLERGRRPRVTQAADAARSSLPVYRNRIDPATGRPNRDRAALGRTQDQALARMALQRRADRAAQAGPAPREPGIYDLRDGRWTPARNVRPPDLTQRLPRQGRGAR